ncbi:MAG: bacteriocin-protection protein [Gemmatimonadetes bacterium]|nr:bacteriocin-protection protein [Gemmatimonadota bacterium]NIQ56215.1 bacteriocin-protection protein [Gemmatimonadota bacterium]NIU76404.1 bacteriocin-protection protein [Gammaproteobacteria bacterium]NIX45884.1 bacteriocin-protection protein [Gemmatimonadota bacterium]NIY10192.1 bacteriocin-protection protein [Gemmatimonadota bacterium]
MEAEAHLDPTHFTTSDDFRAWLEENHARADVLWVGFWKKATGRPSITWSESVEQALCYGWIDGLRRSIDDERYAIRFTPRRPGSTWSARNLETYAELEGRGRIRPPGRAAFERRDPEKTNEYSYEREKAALSDAQLRRFRADGAAWSFFRSQPPSYRKTAIHWVVSAKREETRRRRLDTLIADSAAGLRIKPLRR